MFFLTKLFRLRERAAGNGETKPLLAHLEDLRGLMFRLMILLIGSMLLCFVFQEQLMKVLRAPVDDIWKLQQAEKLPGKGSAGAHALSVDDWEFAKDIEHAANSLSPKNRELFLVTVSKDTLEFDVHTVSLLRGAMALGKTEQGEFVQSIEDPRQRKQVSLMLSLGTPVNQPRGGDQRMMSALKPTETFMLSMRISLVAGAVLALPIVMLMLVQFMLPHINGRKLLRFVPPVLGAMGLFLIGVNFAYFIVLPRGLLFFYQWSSKMQVSNDWRIGEYISFATHFTLLFGIAFELPVLVLGLLKLGVINYDLMKRTRPVAIITIVILAAIMTPPDVFSQVVLGIPMIILYEGCIWIAWFAQRRKLRLAAAPIAEAP